NLKAVLMRWFGFGFNAFGQIYVGGRVNDDDTANEVKVITPIELKGHVDGSCRTKISGLGASWSRRATLHSNGERHTKYRHPLGRFGGLSQHCKTLTETPLCGFPGTPPNLPLIPDGYIALKPPFYRPLSPHLKATRLALGAEHSVLLSASGTVYTWGLGSHGQLGHGGLLHEEQPRVVEALWGMTMSCVAAGGWHTVCVSDAGDMYVWGWNESGQLGLPSHIFNIDGFVNCYVTDLSSYKEKPEGEKDKEVFISIQAFPALLDVTPSCDIKMVGCGSRHTAAVTSAGDLYTWGWGQYGQLGYETPYSDEPRRVEFFREQQMRVVDVTCGTWNTFAAVVKEEVAAS
uniref:RCC1 domain containing 1 n=1 Tax=Hippocampus comes TaxID=109280 RepID=A0A3Q2YUA9_HIPCM